MSQQHDLDMEKLIDFCSKFFLYTMVNAGFFKLNEQWKYDDMLKTTRDAVKQFIDENSAEGNCDKIDLPLFIKICEEHQKRREKYGA